MWVGHISLIVDDELHNYVHVLWWWLVITSFFIAPRIFPIVFNIYKRFIDENTRKKIQILGS